jgi:xanthine dehydrogenase large subunit
MGQGLHTKLQAVCAHELGLPLSRVRVMTTATDKVPNTSATAVSSGADLNGQAVRQACEVLRDRLRPVAAKVLSVPSDEVVFGGGLAFSALDARRAVPFGEVARRAVLEQVPLSATGFYRTPGLHFDRASGQGKPFHYFACGAAVSEVEVSGLTGEHRLRRVDILHDAGRSLAPSIDRGQVEGAFVQGVGWLTCEEVVVDPAGRLLTHSPSTYKIPTAGDVPLDFRVSLLERAEQPGVLHGSKAVGEPPLMLALSVVAALRHALAGFALPGRAVSLRLPATPEAVLLAVEAVRRPSAPT